MEDRLEGARHRRIEERTVRPGLEALESAGGTREARSCERRGSPRLLRRLLDARSPHRRTQALDGGGVRRPKRLAHDATAWLLVSEIPEALGLTRPKTHP